MVNMLGLAKRCRARMLQASTSEVYGDPEVHPQTEDYWGHVNPIGPRSCYDEGKRVAESLCMNYHQAHQLEVRIVRIFNTYGPRMDPDDGRVVSNFITQALRGEPLTIFGDGTQTRSFCYVDDLVEGLMRLMDQNETIGPVNLGNPGEFTMLELAEKVLKLTGSKSKLSTRTAAGRRPETALPRHHPRQDHFEMGAESVARRGTEKDDSVLQKGAGVVACRTSDRNPGISSDSMQEPQGGGIRQPRAFSPGCVRRANALRGCQTTGITGPFDFGMRFAPGHDRPLSDSQGELSWRTHVCRRSFTSWLDRCCLRKRSSARKVAGHRSGIIAC